MNDKLVDKYYTTSSDISDVNYYYGIEATRLFLISQYMLDSNIKKMNPVNIELLVDFQTTMGVVLSVTSTDIAKHGKSALSAASFEQPIEAFRKAGGMGNKDMINNIPSCLITGKKCHNGTGLPEILFDQEYLEDEMNKAEDNFDIIKLQKSSGRDIIGGCFGSGVYEKGFFGEEEKEEELVNTEQEEPLVVMKRKSKGKKEEVQLDLDLENFDEEEIEL